MRAPPDSPRLAGAKQRKSLPYHALGTDPVVGFPAPTHASRASQVTTPSDDRSPAAIAYQWASRIMVVALEMVLPGLAGYWLDKQLGTKVLFTLVGFGLGTTAAMMHLIRMTRTDERRNKNN